MSLPQLNNTLNEQKLYLALELSARTWKLCFGTAGNKRKRLRSISAGDLTALEREIARARETFHLSSEIELISCYEAGRDGFWLHHYLEQQGYKSHVVDSSSIEVKRQARHKKTDRLDAYSLHRLLMRYDTGEQEVWQVCHIPSEAEEDKRRIHRERERLLKEKNSHANRIESLLVLHGLHIDSLTHFSGQLDSMRTYDGHALPADLCAELRREYERYQLVLAQFKSLERQMRHELKSGLSRGAQISRYLYQLRGIGLVGAWLFSQEFFAWRHFSNRRQVGSCAGLTPTPYQSGDSQVEQGISKAGNRHIRKLAIEIAWLWLRYQKNSQLSHWYQQRFASGGKRMRRIGIVALARKLLVALWKYIEFGVVPEGAVLKAV